MMRANGLALGGGLDNAIVMDDYKVLAGGLRCDRVRQTQDSHDAMGITYVVGEAAARQLQRHPLETMG
jgi:UDP-3-O-[3-hydroxymyristoyl] N-acetylglucosamine deacetylase